MTTPIRAILATDPSGIIGLNGTLPWRYRADMQRFKQVTQGGVLIMGRKTWESIPKPKSGGEKLPGRDIIVLSRDEPGCAEEVRESLEGALMSASDRGKPIWIAGGAQVYEEALRKGYIDELDVTLVPEVKVPEGASVTRLSAIANGSLFLSGDRVLPEGFLADGLVHAVCTLSEKPDGLRRAMEALTR